ncbi:hypothetical protein UCMB321_1313 [Pseudomonas batumici]|uniref:Uncharacterized protein n=1 Tax=Pseudomonas batumici TaxID=226910 RepID=A0A0C2IDF5_9PSED|nr:hypothetical protein UCMB321_1313 [Pseudomonas batumici]
MISRVWPPRIPMTNQQHQLKAPRSSCRHVCGFKLHGAIPGKRRILYHSNAQNETRIRISHPGLLRAPRIQARMAPAYREKRWPDAHGLPRPSGRIALSRG